MQKQKMMTLTLHCRAVSLGQSVPQLFGLNTPNFFDSFDLQRFQIQKQKVTTLSLHCKAVGLRQTVPQVLVLNVKTPNFLDSLDLQRFQILRAQCLSNSSQQRLEQRSQSSRRLDQGLELRSGGFERLETEDLKRLELRWGNTLQ